VSSRLAFLFDTAIGYGAQVDAQPMAVPMLGHALREMTRILPRFVNIPVEKKRVEYPKALDAIAADWDAVNRAARVLTPKQFTALDGLVTEHKASAGRARARATALARTTPYGAASEDPAVLDGLVSRWKKLEAEIARLTHVSDDGATRPASDARRVLEAYEALLDHTRSGLWQPVIDRFVYEGGGGGPQRHPRRSAELSRQDEPGEGEGYANALRRAVTSA
jgi:hypothetical protein